MECGRCVDQHLTRVLCLGHGSFQCHLGLLQLLASCRLQFQLGHGLLEGILNGLAAATLDAGREQWVVHGLLDMGNVLLELLLGLELLGESIIAGLELLGVWL